MADNFQVSAGTADGPVFASDDIGGVHYQRTKLQLGADGSATDALGGAGAVSAGVQRVTLASDDPAVTALQVLDNIVSGNEAQVDIVAALPAGTNNIGDVDVLTVPADPFGANADAASATGSISAKLRFIAGTGIPVTGNVTVVNAGTFAVQAAQSGTWNVRNQDGSGNAITSATRGSERALTVQVVDASGNQVTSFSGSGTQSAISTNNSSTAALGAGATFTGTADEITQYTSISVSVIASHASATDGLSIEQSSDGTNWDIVDTYTVPAATGRVFGVQAAARYLRVRYTNGGTLQTSFRLQTVLKAAMPNSSSVRPQDARTNESDMQEVIGYLAGYNGTTWDRLRSDTTNGLDVDVTRLPALATGSNTIGAVNIAAAQTLATVTTVGTVTNITNQGNLVDDAAFTPGTTRVMISGYHADETATDSVDEGDGGAARMTLDRKQIVTQHPHTQGGLSIATGSITATATAVKASAGQVYGWYFYNPNASVAYVQFFNTASGSVTLGTTAPVYSLGIPATSAANVMMNCGVAHSTAITIAVTTTRAGSTSPGSSVDFNIYYF